MPDSIDTGSKTGSDRSLDLSRVLTGARAEGWAVGAFNATGFEVMLAAGRAAAALGTPAIVQTSASVVRLFGPPLLRGWFDLARTLSGASLYLHLDHCADAALISRCIEAGWHMAMFDGSRLPLEENIRCTREIATLAHQAGVAVEGELGVIGGVEDGHRVAPSAQPVDPQDAARFVEMTGVNCLAIGFGNAHGRYGKDRRLRWQELEAVGKAVGIPLVLHGGTGLTPGEYRRAIECGCAKVNISTALKEQYAAILGDPAAASQPANLHQALLERCQGVCEDMIRQLRSR